MPQRKKGMMAVKGIVLWMQEGGEEHASNAEASELEHLRLLPGPPLIILYTLRNVFN